MERMEGGVNGNAHWFATKSRLALTSWGRILAYWPHTCFRTFRGVLSWSRGWGHPQPLQRFLARSEGGLARRTRLGGLAVCSPIPLAAKISVWGNQEGCCTLRNSMRDRTLRFGRDRVCQETPVASESGGTEVQCEKLPPVVTLVHRRLPIPNRDEFTVHRLRAGLHESKSTSM